MASPDSSVDMEISDGAESNLSDMEVSDSDIDPPQPSHNLTNFIAQPRVTDMSQMTQNVYTHQMEAYYRQAQYGYYPELAYSYPPREDDNDSLSSFFTAPLAAGSEDEPGLIRDEEEADIEALAYYKEKVAEYERQMEQTEKEKRKLQQELLRLQVLTSMEKNKKSKQLRGDTPPKASQETHKEVSVEAHKPSTPTSKTANYAPAVTAAPSPSTSQPASVAPSVSVPPPVSPIQWTSTRNSSVSTVAPVSASTPSSTPWIPYDNLSIAATPANTSMRPAVTAQTKSTSINPVTKPPLGTTTTNSKMTLSSLAQSSIPVSGISSPMNTRPPIPSPASAKFTSPAKADRAQSKSLDDTINMMLNAQRPKTTTELPPIAPARKQSQPPAAGAQLPTLRSVQNQRPSSFNASPNQAKKDNSPGASNYVKPSSKGAFKPYESPLKRYGLANTNTNGPKAENITRALCNYETVGGTCNDDTCQALHFRDFQKNA